MAQRVPVFEKPVPACDSASQTLNKILSPFQRSSKKHVTSPSCGQSSLIKYAMNHPQLKLEVCSCPHVLIADDDPFQHFYYQGLFQKSLEFGAISISRESFRISLCFSGEELVKKFLEIKSCGCNNLLLVITDYQMGDLKLNGIETAIKVRDAGYKGSLVLRTSEIEEDLRAAHKDYDQLLKSKVLDNVLGKGDIKRGKDLIQYYLEQATKNLQLK